MNNPKHEQNSENLIPLNAGLVLDLWSRTYNTPGKPDWAHIFPFYTKEIIFQDPIQKVVGKDAFVDLCNRLTKRCKELNLEGGQNVDDCIWARNEHGQGGCPTVGLDGYCILRLSC